MEALLFLALAALAVALGWTGYIASDDASYYGGAAEWLENPPFAGVDHWTTRFPVVLSLAAAMLLLGPGPLPLAAAGLFWYASFLAVGTALAWRIGGARVALIAAVLLGTLPLVATAASIFNCDLPEATLLLAGLWLLASPAGAARARAWAAPVGAGLCFGLAILCRETAILPLMGFLPVFVLGRPLPRRLLLLAAAGAAAVLASEMLFQLAVSGDPLHRYQLALNHDDSLSRAAAGEGNLLLHPLIDPLLVLLLNNEFALLFWAAAAALAARSYRDLGEDGGRVLLLMAAMAASAFLLVGLLSTKLVLNPRYFTVTTVPAAILVALWLSRLRPIHRGLLLAALVATNLLMLSVQNADPRWPAQALHRAASEHRGAIIAADADVAGRASMPLAWSGLDNVRTQDAGAAALLFLEESENASANGAPAAGAVVARYPSPPTPLGRMLTAAGVDRRLPASLRDRLVHPNPTMVLVRRSAPQPRP